jgi:hypothetical protein
MITLRQARETNRLPDFIDGREAEARAESDAETFNRGLRSMAGTSKEAPKTSPRRGRGG